MTIKTAELGFLYFCLLAPPPPPPANLETSGVVEPIVEVAPAQQAAERQAFEMNMDTMQREQQWIMDLINPQ